MDKEESHENKPKKTEKEAKKPVQDEEYWSKHRITLFAYEAQFMISRKEPLSEVV